MLRLGEASAEDWFGQLSLVLEYDTLQGHKVHSQ